MAPTLMGPAEVLRCPTCRFQSGFPIASVDANQDDMGCRCPQCGDELNATGEILPADRVKTNQHSKSFKRGDLVAIARTNSNRISQRVVKRIVGIPGDQVALSGSLITINGVLIDDLPWARGKHKPTVLVYRETGQGRSRWTTEGEWLVYNHINPYRGSMPSPVLDDYAVNVNVSRRLKPVTQLFAQLEPRRDSTSNSEIVIWNPDGDGSQAAPISQSSPVAVRVTDRRVDPREIEIRRSIVYRLRPSDDRSRYPIRLDKDEYFVLGDNVPISVDSRNWGPVSREKVLCSVTPVEK